MTRKLRISAENVQQLRAFLSDADVDLGCRPVARRRGSRSETIVLASDEEFGRLAARRSAGVLIEDLGELPEPATRLRMSRPGNRFSNAQIPRGLGVKE
jgi:hypothetical protein